MLSLKDPLKMQSFQMLQKLRQLLGKISFREVFLISLALHLFVISFPRDATVFDEAYYTKAGRDLLNGLPSNIEHPFLGKAWGAIGIALIGDNWAGWRIPYVIFGQLTLIAFYYLAKHFLDEKNATYATALLAFDTIFFIHGSLYLLEVPALFFSILGFYLYFKKSYYLSALAWAVAALCKETSLFILFALGLYHIFKYTQPFLKERNYIKPRAKQLILFFTIFILAFSIPVWIYDVTYHPSISQLVLTPAVIVNEQGSTIGTTTLTSTVTLTAINNPIEHIQYVLKYMSSLTINPSSQVDQNNYALNWVLPLPPKEIVYYSIAISKNVTETSGGNIISTKIITTNPIHWVGLGNYPLWIGGFWIVMPCALYLVLKKMNSETELFTLLWIAGTYLPLLAISYLINRIVYPFYFINTVPALALGLPAILDRLSGEKYKNYTKLAFMLAVLLWFFWYFPVRITQF